VVKTIHDSGLLDERRQPLRGCKAEQPPDLGPIDAQSAPRNRLNGLITRKQKALERTDAWIVPPALNPSDRRLGDTGSRCQGTLRQPASPSSAA